MDFRDALLVALIAAVVGTVAGAIASISTASRIAQKGERVREELAARDRLLATVRGYRAAVCGHTGLLARKRSRPADNPLTDESGIRFAESIERDVPFLDPRLAVKVREHLVTVIGNTHAAIARDVAFLPEEQRHREWRSDAFLRVKDQVPAHLVLGRGLLGAAAMYDAQTAAGESLVAELQSMEVTILTSGSRIGRKRLTSAAVPQRVR